MYGTTLRYARSAKTLRRKLAEQARQFELERALDDEKARELLDVENSAVVERRRRRRRYAYGQLVRVRVLAREEDGGVMVDGRRRRRRRRRRRVDV